MGGTKYVHSSLRLICSLRDQEIQFLAYDLAIPSVDTPGSLISNTLSVLGQALVSVSASLRVYKLTLGPWYLRSLLPFLIVHMHVMDVLFLGSINRKFSQTDNSRIL